MPTGALLGQSVVGRVLDEVNGAPVARVGVALMNAAGQSVARAQTDLGGAFGLQAPRAGDYRLRFQVPGYRLLVSPFFVLDAGTRAEYSLTLTPVAPQVLDTLLVEGHPIPTYMAGFYARRSNAFGSSLTRDEFMRYHPVELSDIVRHLAVLDVLPSSESGRGYRIRGSQERRLLRACPPAIFVDGVYMGTADEFDVDAAYLVDGIEAVEAYGGDAGLPAEFWRGSTASCGVLSLWTRTVAVRGSAEHFDLAAHVAGRVGASGVGLARVGLGMVIGAAGPFELVPGFGLLVPALNTEAGGGSGGWQAFLYLRWHPGGTQRPWYVGVGGTALYLNRQDRLGSTGPKVFAVDEAHYVLLTGFIVPLRAAVRPYAEAQVFDLGRPGRTEIHCLTGLTFRLF